jgi:hypothetical protein
VFLCYWREWFDEIITFASNFWNTNKRKKFKLVKRVINNKDKC